MDKLRISTNSGTITVGEMNEQSIYIQHEKNAHRIYLDCFDARVLGHALIQLAKVLDQ